jgi:WhiB family redox-sensing transcriptional regulator
VDWRHRAACVNQDPELFFPVGNDGPALRQISKAKTVCRQCPVSDSCLIWAMRAGETVGIWGGMTEDERRELRRWESKHARVA